MGHVLYYNCPKGERPTQEAMEGRRCETSGWGLKTLNPLLGRRSGSRHNHVSHRCSRKRADEKVGKPRKKVFKTP